MRTLLLTFFIAFASILTAQNTEEANTLPNQYNDLKSSSNNYQIYKVVKETSLDAFWASVRDTIKAERAEITALKNEVSGLKKDVSSLNAQVSERDTRLDEQEHMIEHMSFLGISLTKGTYVAFTWILIFVLFAAALILYFRFHGAHKVTAETRREIESIQLDFESHKQRTRENETKLKRDLQTELNRVEELKAQLEGNS